MPRRTKKRGKKRQQGNSTTPTQIYIDGPWGMRLGLPIARLPIKLGADRKLNANSSVYPLVNLDVPMVFNSLPMAAGAISSVLSIDRSQISNFATRFGALFDEYCIVGMKLEVRLNTVGNPSGLMAVYLDEKSSAAPTGAPANGANRLDMAVVSTESPSRYEIDWKARDYTDLAWTATTTTVTPVYVKFFSSVATTATTATTTCNVLVTGTLACCFRGYVD